MYRNNDLYLYKEALRINTELHKLYSQYFSSVPFPEIDRSNDPSISLEQEAIRIIEKNNALIEKLNQKLRTVP